MAGVGNDGSVAAYGGLELALGGAIGGGAQGGAAGVLKWLGKETGEANLGSGVSSSALSGKEENEAAAQWDHRGEWMSRPGARPHHGGLAQPSSCVARRVAALDAAALPRRQSTPPAQHCSNPYPLVPSFVVLQNSSKI